MMTESRADLSDRADNLPRTRAAEYVRMSTEHQQYSTSNQRGVIRTYAEKRGFEIVRTYADEGKSGLSLTGRDSLRQLIEDVQNGQADYQAILVYDISRWGRFQDADESAYYEYLCKRAGIVVHYCAEQFENDGGPTSTIIKSVKRAMAGEYSRELSTKVFQGQCRLIELGFRQGGPPGYGLRRMLLDQSGEQKGTLSRGQQKSLQTDRVILVPGPELEVGIVQLIYRMFTTEGKTESEIASFLNGQGIVTDLGRPWTRSTVFQVLTNEKYIGNNVYNRRSFKLKRKRVNNVPEMWVRANGAFEAIVSTESFYVARGIIQERSRQLSNEEMLEHLRAIFRQHARISSALIDSTDGAPPSSSYRTRFQSLVQAYQLAGCVLDRDYRFIDVNRALRNMYPGLLDTVVRDLSAAGACVCRDSRSGLLLINGEYSACLAMSRCRQTTSGSLRWFVRLDRKIVPDITVLVRMDADNIRPIDYYLLPIMDIEAPTLLLCESNGAHLDTYQFQSLDFFAQMATRTKIEEAA